MSQQDDRRMGRNIDPGLRRAHCTAKIQRVMPPSTTSATLHSDREMLGAALLFTAATLCGSMVAIRLDLAAEPFGIRLALPVPAAVALGWGTALSAPWPMPAAALFAVRHARRSTGPGPGLVHIGLGTGALIGGLGEPVLRSAHRQTKTVRAVIAVNLLAASILIAAGLRQVFRKPTAATIHQEAVTPLTQDENA
jgi:hypothetical protein